MKTKWQQNKIDSPICWVADTRNARAFNTQLPYQMCIFIRRFIRVRLYVYIFNGWVCWIFFTPHIFYKMRFGLLLFFLFAFFHNLSICVTEKTTKLCQLTAAVLLQMHTHAHAHMWWDTIQMKTIHTHTNKTALNFILQREKIVFFWLFFLVGFLAMQCPWPVWCVFVVLNLSFFALAEFVAFVLWNSSICVCVFLFTTGDCHCRMDAMATLHHTSYSL